MMTITPKLFHIARPGAETTLCGYHCGALLPTTRHVISVLYDEAAIVPRNWCTVCAARHLHQQPSAFRTVEQNNHIHPLVMAPDASLRVKRNSETLWDSKESGPSASARARDVLNPDNIRKVDRKQPILNDED